MSTENKVQSFGVAATLSAQRGVYISAKNTVAYPTALTQLPVGITIDDVTETTQGIAVATAGAIAKLEFGGSVAAGGLVTLQTGTGLGIAYAEGSTTSDAAFLGTLVGGAASTGTVAEVFIQPGIGG